MKTNIKNLEKKTNIKNLEKSLNKLGIKYELKSYKTKEYDLIKIYLYELTIQVYIENFNVIDYLISLTSPLIYDEKFYIQISEIINLYWKIEKEELRQKKLEKILLKK